MTYIALVPTISDRIRQRIKDEMETREISQRDLADVLSRRTNVVWTQSRVGKVLTGRVELKLDDLYAIAEGVGLTLCEAVRDPGMEFFAEMTPIELRLFQILRRQPHVYDAFLQLVGIGRPAGEVVTLPARPKRGRPLNSERAKQEWASLPTKVEVPATRADATKRKKS